MVASSPLAAYAVMTAVMALRAPDSTRDADLVDDHRGLFWLRSVLSLAFAAALLSLAAGRASAPS